MENIKDRFNYLVEIICEATGIDPESLLTKTRLHPIPEMRYMIMKILYKPYNYWASTASIGKLFGKCGRNNSPMNHATVINGIKRFNNYYDTEKEYKDLYDNIYHKYRLKFPNDSSCLNIFNDSNFNKKALTYALIGR